MMVDLGMERDFSKAATFVNVLGQLIRKSITGGMFLQMCNHLFVHDLPLDERKTLLADLSNAVQIEDRKHKNCDATGMCDQYSAIVRDLCKAAFETRPVGEPQEALVAQLVGAANQTVAQLPVYLGDGVVMAYTAFDRRQYTPQEATQIIDETTTGFLQAFNDAKVKVQHMRDGENW